MGSLLLPLPVLAIVLAALDSVLARLAHPWRPSDVRLFFGAYYLWASFGLLALLPAAWTLRAWDKLLERRVLRGGRWSGETAPPWLVLLGWMVIPVIAHGTLDRHTSLVGLAGLEEAGPWLELGTALIGSLGVLLAFGRLLAPLPGARTAALGVLLAVGTGIFFPLHGSGGTGAEEAGQTPRPNLLLLVLDTCRSDRLQPYGFERTTSPGLERLAQESVLFEDSLSVSSFTFTSHLSLLTGVMPSKHGARLLDMRFDPERATSIAALLSEQGYRTGAFVGTDVLAGRTGLHTGFDVYDDAVDPVVCDTYAWRLVHDLQSIAAELVPTLRLDGRPHWIQDFQRPGKEVLDHALSWIRRRDPRPWFCFVNLYDVHWPYLPEGQGRDLLVRPYDGPLDGFLFRSQAWDPTYRVNAEDKRHVSDLYEAEIFDLDRGVRGFLDNLGLERGGTAVLVTADHGEGLGEEDTWTHDDIREPQVRVPLIVRPPEPHPRGRRSAAPVSGLDVAPTLLGLAGVARPNGPSGPNGPSEMGGHDLLANLPYADRERWVEDRDHLDPNEVRIALYRGTWKLERIGVGAAARYEFYDLTTDPLGTHDVQAKNPGVFADYVRRFEAERGAPEASVEGLGDLGGSADALRALGYGGN